MLVFRFVTRYKHEQTQLQNQLRGKEEVQYLTKDSLIKIFAILAIAVAVQLLHMMEHVAQLIDKFIPNLLEPHSLFLGQSIDIEPLHFIYNICYLALVAFVWLRFRNMPIRKTMLLAYGILTFVLVFQSWHFVEHTVKLEQYFVDGCETCPGILGHFISLPMLHFAYNLIVLVPLVIVLYLVIDYDSISKKYRRYRVI